MGVKLGKVVPTNIYGLMFIKFNAFLCILKPANLNIVKIYIHVKLLFLSEKIVFFLCSDMINYNNCVNTI